MPTSNKIKRKLGPPPFHFDYYYPSTIRQFATKNIVFDGLYPIKPWIFTTTVTGVSSYFYVHSVASRFMGSGLGIIVAGVVVALVPVLVLRSILYFFFFRYKGHLFESPDRLSLTSRFWALCFLILRKYAPPRLLTCNALLPNQPVPTLHKTILRYMRSMEAITEQRDFVHMQSLIPKFLSIDGPRLQQKALLKSWISRNYVTPFWEEFAYLRRREPLLINTSVCSVDFLATPMLCTQASRAAHIAYLTTLQMLSFGDQSQSPPANGLMYSGYYKRLFANARVPGNETDRWEPRGYSRHVVVFSKGCFYRLDMFDSTDKIYTADQLTDVIEELLERDDQSSDSERKIAALAHDWRSNWAENRQKFFCSNPINAKFLQEIESSIFFLVLDEADSYGYDGDNDRLSNFTRSILTGNGMNRWPDKPMNIICAKNGRAAACSEHSFADGPEYVHFMENLFGTDTHYLNYPCRRGEKLAHYKPMVSNLKLATRLEVELVDGMASEIQRCYREYSLKASDVDVASFIFVDWGKGRIKSTNCSPDAFFQMAIQLAYFKDQGTFAPTYEAAANRFYDYSRTETIRTVTQQSCKFVYAMVNKTKPKPECARLLVNACNKHQHNSRLAMTGQGIDRHLFALYIISKGLKIESDFLDDYIKREWTLSTTQTPYLTTIMDEDNGSDDERWMGGIFGAVAQDGYGVAYHFMGRHSIAFHISSYHSASTTGSRKFRALLIESLREMIQLF